MKILNGVSRDKFIINGLRTLPIRAKGQQLVRNLGEK